MVKQRSGLGRGLSSLLNGAAGESAPAEKPNPVVERIVVESEERHAADATTPLQRVQSVKPAETAPVPRPVQPAQPAPAVKEVVQEEEEVKEELYTNAEDNITIKGVVEREVHVEEAPAVQEIAPSKDAVENDSSEVAIDLVVPNPNQPRTSFKKNELEELAESIKKNGLLQPILVRRLPEGGYQIIAGERRWQACKSIGLETVPIRIYEADEDKAIELAMVENVQRIDLNPIEEAYGYRRMMERGNMTQSEVAQAVSKGRSTIANALRLLELPEDAQQLLFEEKITAGHARAILSIPDKEGRRKLTEKLVEEQISVREAEAIARLLASKDKPKKQERPPAPKSYKTVARSLSETLGSTVKIKSAKGKNRIEIEFKDEADLERLFRKITSPSA